MQRSETNVVQPIVHNHFKADEGEQYRQSCFEVMKQVHYFGDEEKQRTQTNDGENIREENYERIGCDGEYCGY